MDCFTFMSLVCSLWVSSEMMSKLSPLHDKSTKCEQCMNQIWTVMTVHNGAVVQTLCGSPCLVLNFEGWDRFICKITWHFVTYCWTCNRIKHEMLITFHFKAHSLPFTLVQTIPLGTTEFSYHFMDITSTATCSPLTPKGLFESMLLYAVSSY